MGSDSGKDTAGPASKADDGFSFFKNLSEDLGSIFDGTAKGPHSAYDTRNADAMATKTGMEAKHFQRGGAYGPGSLDYNPSQLHAAGVADAKQRAAQAAHENRSGRLETRRASSDLASGDPASNEPTNAGALTVKSTSAAAVESTGLLTKNAQARSLAASSMPTPVAEDEASTGAPLGSSSGPKTRRAANHPASQPTSAERVFTTASNKTLPGVDPSWGPSATPAQQARNILRTQKNEEKRQQQAAKAQQTAAAAARSTQNKGALQSALERFNLSPAAPQTPQARTPDQKAADVGEQPLSGSVGPDGRNVPADVARIQRALVRNGAMNPANATGYIGTATLDATRAFQNKNGLKIDGLITPGGPTEAALMDGTIEKWRAEQGQKFFGKPTVVSEFKDFRDEFNQRRNNPKYNTMTPKEALAPVAKYGALKLTEDGASIVSSKIKNRLVGDMIDMLGTVAGVEAQRVKRDYLENPQAKSKKSTMNKPKPKTEEITKSTSQLTLNRNPPVPKDDGLNMLLKNIDTRQSTEDWYAERLKKKK